MVLAVAVIVRALVSSRVEPTVNGHRRQRTVNGGGEWKTCVISGTNGGSTHLFMARQAFVCGDNGQVTCSG